MKLGVFDSGIGGEAVARSLQHEFPKAKIFITNDKARAPYGSRSQSEIIALTDAAIQPLLQYGCDVIVIACNTATTQALPTLRLQYPNQKFIGIEPMIKPAAALTKSGVITVCATPATLSSNRYHELIAHYAQHLTVLEPDCSEWASMIERNEVNAEKVHASIAESISKDSDVIVLGCTHYHWIKQLIQTAAGGSATILEPSAAIAQQVKRLLKL